ncbi:MAG: alpha/beta fold hydrolase [Solirubrobacteraceae bacterium]|nr:alpha/beta fold hydrolase [Solirubrobacteraceae bacterium]
MNILGELRIPLELGTLMRSEVWHGRGVRRGNGERILAIPGLFVGDETLRPMRGWLARIGYHAEGSGIRSNIGCSERVMVSLERRAEQAHRLDGRRIHVIGQSRGGMLAHVLGVRRPDLVASVTTLGSPISGTIDDFHPLLQRNLTWLSRLGDTRGGYIATSCWVGAPGRPVPDTATAHDHPEVLDPVRTRTCCEDFWPDLLAELPSSVLGTAIYSRSDGLIRAKACVAPGYHAVEVTASHVGMATSSAVYHAVATALARSSRDESRVPRNPAPALIDRRRRPAPPAAGFERRAS